MHDLPPENAVGFPYHGEGHKERPQCQQYVPLTVHVQVMLALCLIMLEDSHSITIFC